MFHQFERQLPAPPAAQPIPAYTNMSVTSTPQYLQMTKEEHQRYVQEAAYATGVGIFNSLMSKKKVKPQDEVSTALTNKPVTFSPVVASHAPGPIILSLVVASIAPGPSHPSPQNEDEKCAVCFKPGHIWQDCPRDHMTKEEWEKIQAGIPVVLQGRVPKIHSTVKPENSKPAIEPDARVTTNWAVLVIEKS